MKTWQAVAVSLSYPAGGAIGLWAPWWVTTATLAISGAVMLVAAGCVAVGALRDRRRRPTIPLARVLTRPRDRRAMSARRATRKL